MLGGLLLLDLGLRAFDLESLYSDRGLLPRELLLQLPRREDWPCLHLGTASPWMEGLLFALAGACAVQLIRGRHTRWMTLASWVLLNSLHQRNPFVNDRGDLELSLVLFWSMFLPLDCSRAQRYRSWAFTALVLQFSMIYAFAALFKHDSAWLVRGDALWQSLRSALFCTRFGFWLSGFAGALHLLTFLVPAFELAVAGLLLAGPRARMLAVGLLVGFHVLVGLSWHLGLFPLIGALLPLGLLPTEFWDRFRLPVPPGAAEPFQLSAPETGLVVLALALCLESNLASLRGQPPLGLSRALRLEQHWDLFAPRPPLNGWFVFEGTRADGAGQVDLLRPGQELSLDRPADPSAVFPDHRWRMLMISLLFPAGQPMREPFCRYLLSRWSGPPLSSSRLLFVRDSSDEAGNPLPRSQETLWP